MKLKPNIAVSENGFLFDPNTGESYNLNKSAQLIVNQIKQNKGEEEIMEFVKRNFDVEDDVIQHYLDDFTRMLEQYQLIDKKEY